MCGSGRGGDGGTGVPLHEGVLRGSLRRGSRGTQSPRQALAYIVVHPDNPPGCAPLCRRGNKPREVTYFGHSEVRGCGSEVGVCLRLGPHKVWGVQQHVLSG